MDTSLVIILEALETQRFKDWYERRFVEYIEGDLAHNNKISHEQARELILADIRRIFRIE